ncbi:hypothetical protein PHYPSEUDO_007106 [Phytophthora pseudosyringae]|uniref:Uncharacterized protein n=1 Tax=Phytophthora pseudosyringae TaxID=221518 RepID=A0A8T1WEA7_9STRA|nr:hypothetical protein PHYPSEUDO_007106 [Phytophthora pseudosyringae]
MPPTAAALNREAGGIRCSYRSKRCDRPRSLKRNGDLHRFCDYHRTKANVNQRRVDRKRREMTHKQTLSVCSPRSTQDTPFFPDVAWFDDLDPQDLEYLDQLLSAAESDDGKQEPSADRAKR